MDAILFKKGCVESMNNTHVILSNEDEQEIRVNKTVYIIWEMCKGIHFNDLLISIALGSNVEAERLRTSLERLVDELCALNLLDIENVPKN